MTPPKPASWLAYAPSSISGHCSFTTSTALAAILCTVRSSADRQTW